MPAGLDGNPDPIVTPQRSQVIGAIADTVARSKRSDRPLLIGIDGIDGSGKSTFADELALALASTPDIGVVRSTIDSFHNPREVRLRRGATSPVGFYLDSHNLDAVRSKLLDPFASGTGDYVAAAFDAPSDCHVAGPLGHVRATDVLIFDGIFLQRPELVGYWNLVVFLDGQERVDLRRLQYVLDDLPQDPAEVVAHVLEWQRRIDRYASGMRYYLDLVAPQDQAHVLIDNNDLTAPRIVRMPVGANRAKTTADAYDSAAADFAERTASRSTVASDFFELFLAQLDAGSLVGDLGCGPGHDLGRLAAAGHRAFGLDRSAGLLALCPGVGQRALGDLRAIPLASGSLDAIWSSAALLHISATDLIDTFAEWDRVLVAGGSVGFATSLGGDEGWELVPASPTRVAEVAAGHQRWFVHHTEEALHAAVAAVGWTITWSAIRRSSRDWLQVLATKPS